MLKEKSLRIELSRENPVGNGYLYSTLELPAEEYEIRDALQRAHIGNETDVYHDITILDSPYVYDLQDMRLDSPTIDELNFLSKRLAAMDETERLIYVAVLPKAIGDDDIVSMKTLINCTYGLDEVMIASNVTNDQQLGEFVIENELHDDINAIPEQSLYLLDRSKVGELYRTTFGTVFMGNLCVFAGDYEMPEIYDGEQLPENEISDWFAFRLKIAPALVEDVSEVEDKAAWLSLPAQKQKVKRVARELSAGKIEDCVYLDFESCVPQITSEQLGDMRDFDKFNRLATMMFEMSPRDQVQFKAVLEAEKPADIDGVIDIAENMWRYDSYGFATDESEFFKHYLLHHLDTRFDPQWLDSINAYNEGAALLDRLGAKITPYCVVSARDRSLYEFVPFQKMDADAKKLSAQSLTDEKLEVVEVLGQTALFTNGRVTEQELPEGLYKYELREGESIGFATIEPKVSIDHCGTVLLKAPLDFGDEEYFAFDEDTSPNFLGYELTPREFMETDFTQTEDDTEQDNSQQIGGMQL